jgi:hypothetical protein
MYFPTRLTARTAARRSPFKPKGESVESTIGFPSLWGEGDSADTSEVLPASNSAFLNDSFRTFFEIKCPRLGLPIGQSLERIAEGKMTGTGGYEITPLRFPADKAVHQQGYLRKVARYGYTS